MRRYRENAIVDGAIERALILCTLRVGADDRWRVMCERRVCVCRAARWLLLRQQARLPGIRAARDHVMSSRDEWLTCTIHSSDRWLQS